MVGLAAEPDPLEQGLGPPASEVPGPPKHREGAALSRQERHLNVLDHGQLGEHRGNLKGPGKSLPPDPVCRQTVNSRASEAYHAAVGGELARQEIKERGLACGWGR
jgi:hypothetical protein